MTLSITKREKVAVGLLVLQLVLPVCVVVLQPGFDKPNSLGLDFDFVIFVGLAYLAAWLASVILSFTIPSRRGWFVLACILSPVIGIGFLALTEGIR